MKILDLLIGVRLCNKSKLLQRSQSAFLSRLINNLAVPQGEDSNPGKVNLLVGVSTVQGTNRQIANGNTGVCPTTNPSPNNVGPACDERMPVDTERNVWESL